MPKIQDKVNETYQSALPPRRLRQRSHVRIVSGAPGKHVPRVPGLWRTNSTAKTDPNATAAMRHLRTSSGMQERTLVHAVDARIEKSIGDTSR